MNDEITRYALIGIDAEMARLGELRRKLTEPPEEVVDKAHKMFDPEVYGKPTKRKFSAAGIAAIRAGQLKRRKAEKRKGK